MNPTRTMRMACLASWPRNPRHISPDARRGLAASIERFGLVQPIVWNERTGHVVGGHQRLDVLRERGVEETEVIVVDLDETEEKALNLALNNPGIAGEFTPAVEEILAELRSDAPELVRELRLEDVLEGLEIESQPAESDVDAEPHVDRAEELQRKWGTEAGQLWTLGDHRLLCGDSTRAEDVARVLGEDRPHLMVTDPPYGVEYDPEWRGRAGVDTNTGKMGRVENDDRADWAAAWGLFDGDVAYVWHAGVHASEVQRSLERCGFIIRTQIVWAKERLVLSRGHYHWQHEPAWYAVRRGKTGHWSGDRSQTTLWPVPARDDGGHGHGTQKPVECMARPIRNNSRPGDAVYEPFSGSGTTIIACEQLGRRCRAIEISPGYVAVALERWAEATGRTPALTSTSPASSPPT